MNPSLIVVQRELIVGLYRCHNCEHDVEHIHKFRRWRLCDGCWQQIVASTSPGKSSELTKAEYQAREALWEWHRKMEQKYPSGRNWQRRSAFSQSHYSVDNYYPLCECGRPRRVIPYAEQSGLFGGPYFNKCSICEARASVESIFGMAEKIMPGRDDEEWLDLLYQSHREAFDVGVLPDYWFELKLQAIPL